MHCSVDYRYRLIVCVRPLIGAPKRLCALTTSLVPVHVSEQGVITTPDGLLAV
jgi:hypothetical protein